VLEEITAQSVTALFDDMQTLKFKAQPTNAFFAIVNQMFGSSSQLPTTPTGSNQIVEHSSDNETVLSSSQKLEGAAGHLVDGSKKRICQLSFEF